MLSIGIPTYNTNINELVQEIHKQATLCDVMFEIIVYDDASSITYEPNYVIKELPNLLYITHDTNLGRTITRTNIAKKATYNWVLFLDADTKPTSKNFIKNYIYSIHNNKNADVIFGGIDYIHERPNDQSLRWLYGKQKESKKASERSKAPHFIISQNLLIKKELFLSLNTFEDNIYGLDNVFSSELKRRNINVVHIDNEVYHLGLESNEIFLQKSIDSLKTTILFEKEGIIQNDLRPVQRIYNKLSYLGVSKLIMTVLHPFETKLKKNLLGKNPSIILFDLYRLYHYIQLKKESSA